MVHLVLEPHFHGLSVLNKKKSFDAADDRLMRAIAMADYHVLRQNNLVQLKPPNAYNMRDRKHNFSLPKKSNHLDECNFSSRILYKDIY